MRRKRTRTVGTCSYVCLNTFWCPRFPSSFSTQSFNQLFTNNSFATYHSLFVSPCGLILAVWVHTFWCPLLFSFPFSSPSFTLYFTNRSFATYHSLCLSPCSLIQAVWLNTFCCLLFSIPSFLRYSRFRLLRHLLQHIGHLFSLLAASSRLLAYIPPS